MSGSHLSTFIAQSVGPAPGAAAPEPDVGEILRRIDGSRALTGAELEQHIADCDTLWQRSYARYQEHGLPADREDAVLWLHHMNEAILMRSPAVQAQRHLEFEQRLQAGMDRVRAAAWRAHP